MFDTLSDDAFDLVDEPGVSCELATLQSVADHGPFSFRNRVTQELAIALPTLCPASSE